MKLYLSSQGIPANSRQHFVDLFDKSPSDIRIAYIVDAGDVYSTEEKQGWYDEAIEDLQLAGVTMVELLRLKDYSGQTNSLSHYLQQFDGVFVSGGADYYLRYCMKISGFDTLIKSLSKQSFVYAGYSAGAIVAGPTLQYLDFNDQPKVEPGRIMEGLGLISTIVVPHWNQSIRKPYFNKLIAAYKEHSWEYTTLRDDQALVVTNGELNIVE